MYEGKAVVHKDKLPVPNVRSREMPPWEECEHRWQEIVGDHDYPDTQVICPKCLCPGEFYEDTQSVYWPVT